MLKTSKTFGLPMLVALSVLLAACGGPNGAATSAPGNALQEDPYLQVPRVSLEDATTAFNAGSATFVDVRASASYAYEHIPGALNIPLAEIEGRLGELDKAEWIITYCT